MSYERKVGDQYFPVPEWALRESFAGEVLRKGASQAGAGLAMARAARTPYFIAIGNDTISSTETTNEEIAVEVVIPGGAPGTNGGIRVSVWSESAGANTGNRDIFIRYGGQFLGEGRLAVAATPAAAGMSQYEIWNKSETSQIGQHATSSSLNAIATAPAFKAATVNSAVDQVLQIRTKKSVATDDLKILRWSVEVIPPLA